MTTALAAALLGASTPQGAALPAARWSHALTGRRPELGTAFALESMSNEASFLIGPSSAPRR